MLNQFSVSSVFVHTSSRGPWIRYIGIRAGSTKARKRNRAVDGRIKVAVLALAAPMWISAL